MPRRQKSAQTSPPDRASGERRPTVVMVDRFIESWLSLTKTRLSNYIIVSRQTFQVFTGFRSLPLPSHASHAQIWNFGAPTMREWIMCAARTRSYSIGIFKATSAEGPEFYGIAYQHLRLSSHPLALLNTGNIYIRRIGLELRDFLYCSVPMHT